MAEAEHALQAALTEAPNSRERSKLPRRAVLASLACVTLGGLAVWGTRGSRLSPIVSRRTPSGPSPSLAVAPFTAEQAKRHQQAWAHHLGVPVRIVNSAGLPMVLIPAGDFLMGMSDSRLLEPSPPVGDWRFRDPNAVLREQLPRHRVVLTKPIYFGETEVTNGQFRQFVDATGYVTDAERSRGWGREDKGWVKRAGYSWKNLGQRLGEADHPVINVTWNDATALAAWLSSHDSLGAYRLPTEAEWEFACRAGSTNSFFFGDDEGELGKYAWFSANSRGRFQAAGSKAPNPFGIYDMYGNRQEWCLDHYADNYYESSPLCDPVCKSGGSDRVMRGGSHTDLASFCTSARRWFQEAGNPGAAGIRVVCELEYKP